MNKAVDAKEALMSAILADPWNKDHYSKLILHLRDARQEDELEKFREIFASRFLPDALFWRTWLADIVQLGTEEQVHAFFARSFELCPDFDLASDYLGFIEKCVEENEMPPAIFRSLLEPVLSTVGTDLTSGAELWNRYRSLEVEEFEDFIEAAENPRGEEAKAAKEFIIRAVFTRQLGLPLLGNDKVLQEMESFLEEYFENSEEDVIRPDLIKQNFEVGIEKRSKIIQYEDLILTAGENDTTVGEKIRVWREYIKYEIGEREIERSCRLYERAILSLAHETSPRGLLEEYAEYACSLKNWCLLDNITKRGVIVSYDSLVMWKYRMSAIELTQQGDEAFEFAHAKCLTSGLPSPSDYIAALLLKCDYFRRKLLADLNAQSSERPTVETHVDQFRQSLDSAENFLSQYYPGWVEGWSSVLRYRVSTEDLLISDLGGKICGDEEYPSEKLRSVSPSVWENFMTQFGMTCGVVMWKEYLNWAFLITRDLNVCRKILRKGIGLTASDPSVQEALCFEAVAFEERHAENVEDVISAILRVKPKLQKATQAKQQLDEEAQAGINSLDETGQDTRNNFIVCHENCKRNREGAAFAVEPNLKRLKQDDKQTVKLHEGQTHTENIDMPAESTSGMDSVSESSGSPSSIFIKNVSFSATEEEILSMCQACGEIKCYEFLKSVDGKFKGMVLIHFLSPEAARKAVSTIDGRVVRNRNVSVEFFRDTVASKQLSTTTENDGRWHPTTVFASKLPQSYTEVDVREYFEAFGSVKIARLLVDKYSGESKCRALVEFDAADSVIKALECRHIVGSNTVYVTRSKFPAAAPQSGDNKNAERGPKHHMNHKASLSGKNSTQERSNVLNITTGSLGDGAGNSLGFRPRVLKRKGALDLGPIAKRSER